MRTLLLSLSFALAATLPTAVQAASPRHAAAMERALDRALSRHLCFPLMERGDMTGKVYVSFNVDTEGHVQVIRCESVNARLREYVLRKLQRIDIGSNPEGMWRTTHLVIDFHPETRG
jgi:hypothetical protein